MFLKQYHQNLANNLHTKLELNMVAVWNGIKNMVALWNETKNFTHILISQNHNRTNCYRYYDRERKCGSCNEISR